MTTILGPPDCDECSIIRRKLATVRDDMITDGALTDVALVHVTSDTTFFVTAGPDLNELYFATRDGMIVRQVGRSGEGPGE